MARGESASLSSRFTFPLSRVVEDENLDEPNVDYEVFDIGAASLEASNVATIALNYVEGNDYSLMNSLLTINSTNDSSKSGKVSGIGKLKNLFMGGKKAATPKSKETELPDNSSTISGKVKNASSPTDNFFQLPQSMIKHNQQNGKTQEFGAPLKPDSAHSSNQHRQNTGSTDIGFVVTNLNLNQSLGEEHPDPFLLAESGSSFSNPDFEIDHACSTNPDAGDPLTLLDFGKKELWEEPSGTSSHENLATLFGFHSDPFQLIDDLGRECFERDSTKRIPEPVISRKPLVKINPPNSLIPIQSDEQFPEKFVHESNYRNSNFLFAESPSLDFPAFVTEANHSMSPNSSTANNVLFSASSQNRNNFHVNEEIAKKDAWKPSGIIPGMEIQWRTKVGSHDASLGRRSHILSDGKDDLVMIPNKGVFSPTQNSIVSPNLDAMKVTEEANDDSVLERKQSSSQVSQGKEVVVMKDSITPTGLVVQLASKYESLTDNKEQPQIHKRPSLAPSTSTFFPRTSPKAVDDKHSKSSNHQERLFGKDTHNQQNLRLEKSGTKSPMEESKQPQATESAGLPTPTRHIEKVTFSSIEQDKSHVKPSNTSIHRRLSTSSSQKQQAGQLTQCRIIDNADLTHQAHNDVKNEPRKQLATTADSTNEAQMNAIRLRKSRTSNLLVPTELDLSSTGTFHASSPSKISPTLASRISKFNNLSQSELRSRDVKRIDKPSAHDPKGNVTRKPSASQHVPVSTNLHSKPSNTHSSMKHSFKEALFEEKPKILLQSTLQNSATKITLENSSYTDKKSQLERKSPDRTVKMKMIANSKSPARCKSSSKIDTQIQSEADPASLKKKKSIHNDSQTRIDFASELHSFSSGNNPRKFGQQQVNNDTAYFQKNAPSLQKRGMDQRVGSNMSALSKEQRTWDNPIRRRLFSSIAIPIQTEFRRFRGKQLALKRMIALIVIQTWSRRCLSHYSFIQCRKAAVKIETSLRVWMARNLVEVEHYCAELIQLTARGYLSRSRFGRLKESVISLQAMIRGYFSRWMTSFLHQCASILQLQWRAYCAKVNFNCKKLHVQVLQRAARIWLAESRYLTLFIARQRENDLHLYCATLIQCHWRSTYCYVRYLHALADVLAIQSFTRSWIAIKAVKREVARRNASVVVLQATWKSFYHSVIYLNILSDILLMQSVARQFIAREQSKALKVEKEINQARIKRGCAIAIQKHWRSYFCSLRYLAILADIMLIQSQLRCCIARDKKHLLRLEKENDFAAVIQKSWRSYACSINYLNIISWILDLQRKARQWSAVEKKKKIEQNHQNVSEGCAMAIQSHWRSYCCSLKYLAVLLDILLIQCQVRHYFAKETRKLLRSYKVINMATIIQKTWRSYCCSLDYLNVLSCTLQIQSKARQWHSEMQKHILRQEWCALQMKVREGCAIALQTNWRSFYCSSQYLARLSCTFVIQGQFRCWIAEKKKLILREERVQGKVTIIQSSWRSYVCFFKFLNILSCILDIQRKARQWIAEERKENLRQEWNEIKYQVKKACAILLQSSWRSYYSSSKYLSILMDSLLLQSQIRRWIAAKKGKKYIQEKKESLKIIEKYCATMIQNNWRSYFCASKFLRLLTDTLLIQIILRRLIAMKKTRLLLSLREMRMATVIQATWRSYSASLNYLILLSSVLHIQNRARQWIAVVQTLTMKLERKEIQSRVKVRCAVTVQTNWRSWFCSSQYLASLIYILLIQSLFRQSFAMKKRKALRADREKDMATRIQASWRSYICCLSYFNDLTCILDVQCKARQWIAVRQKRILKREWIELQHQVQMNCTIAIQTIWRVYHCSSKYLLVLMHILLIQCQVRRLIALKKNQVLLSEKEIEMAKIIQAAWRSYSFSLNYVYLLSTILDVQRAVRRWIALRKMNTMMLERIDIQSRLNVRCAVSLQTHWRSCFYSSQYLAILFDILLIQGLFRQSAAMKKKKLLRADREKNMATRIQAIWRSYVSYFNYLNCLSCILLMQCKARQWIAVQQKEIFKTEWIELHHQVQIGCTIAIQTHWRVYYCSCKYLSALMDILLVQCQVRRWVALKRSLALLLKKEMGMATTIQAAWRSYSFSLNYVYLLSSVLDLQNVVRQWIAKGQFKKMRLERKEIQSSVKVRCAVTLQTHWRSCFYSSQYLAMLLNSLLIQNLFRQFTAMKKKKLLRADMKKDMVTRIQAVWRSCYCYLNYLNYLSCILDVQCMARQWTAMRQKRILKRKWIEVQHQERLGCTIAIQTHWRVYHCSSEYLLVLMQTVLIQCQVRRLIAFRKTQVLLSERDVEMATIIQAAWRSYSFSLYYVYVLPSILDVQSTVRQWIAVRQVKAMMLERNEIQSRAKACSAITLQALWRYYACSSQYLAMLLDVLVLQKQFRFWAARKVTKLLYTYKMERMATSIQANWRSYVCSMNYVYYFPFILRIQSITRQWIAARQKNFIMQERELDMYVAKDRCALTLQNRLRSYIYSTNYLVVLMDILLLQSHIRRFTAKKEMIFRTQNKKKEKATKIQAISRSYIFSCNYISSLSCILNLQCKARRLISIRHKVLLQQESEAKQNTARKACAIIIQANWRSHCCCSNYQTKKALRSEKDNFMYGSTTIQKYWRSYFCSRIFIDALIDVLLIQSLIRRWIAIEYRKALLLERQKCLALTDAQIIWQSYFCSEVYASTDDMKKCQAKPEIPFIGEFGTTWCSCSHLSYKANGLAEDSHSLVKRCIRDGTSQEKRFKAALTILSFWKSKRRKHLKIVCQQERKRARCAVFVQSIWRSYFASLNYLAVLSATLHVQSSFRRYCSAMIKLKLQRCHLQAVFATTFQSLWRSYDASMTYLSILNEIVYIQSLVRRNAAQRILNNFVLLKSLDSKLKEDSATKIQAAWRCFSFSAVYLHFLSNLVIFQGVGRRFIACRSKSSLLAQRKQFHESCAIAIQTVWRSYDTCVAYTGILSDIMMIQAMARRLITQRKYNNSVLLISLESNIQRDFVTKIQAVWRSFRCSESHFAFLTNLIVIQRFCRKLLALRFYELRLLSRMHQLKTVCASAIQSTWRSYDTHMAYSGILYDIVMIQAVIRRRIAQSRHESSSLYKSLQLKLLVDSATIIQTALRSFTCSSKYLNFLFNLCALQSLCRRYLDLRSFRNMLLEQSKAFSAITIQSLWRSYYTNLLYLCKPSNINLVPSRATLTSITGPKKCDASEWESCVSKQLGNKAVIIQAAWRSFFFSEQYLSFMFNIVVFQGLCRRFISQRGLEYLLSTRVEQLQAVCATAIQRCWRSYDTKLAYLTILCDIIMIQAFVRRRSARLRSSFSNHIQAIGFIGGDSAITIQAAWRSFIWSEKYLRFMFNIVILQSLCRRYISMCTFKSMVLKEADKTALIIQRHFRSYMCRDLFFQSLADIIILQRFVQWWLRQKNIQRFQEIQGVKESGVKEYSASLVQRTWRSHIASTRYLYFMNCILLAQRVTRRHLALIKVGIAALLQAEESALVIQRSWRSRVCSFYYFEQLGCVCGIQSFVRQRLHLKKLNRVRLIKGLRESESQHFFACRLQRFMRPRFATKKFRKNVDSTVMIQSFVRLHITKTHVEAVLLLRAAASAVVIQRIWRSYDALITFFHTLMSVVSVQSVVRKWIARRKVNKTLTKTRHMLLEGQNYFVSLIQSSWRSYLISSHFLYVKTSITVIQTASRRYNARINWEARLCRRSVIMMQSAWRSYYCSVTYLLSLSGIVVFQAIVRQCIQKNKLQMMRILKKHFYSSIIQRTWRTYFLSAQYVDLLTSIIVAQSFVRQHLVKLNFSNDKLIKMNSSANIIQRNWRKYDASVSYIHNLVCTIAIQSVVRQWISSRKMNKTTRRRNAMKLEIHNFYACVLQCRWRSQISASKYRSILSTSVAVQRVFRSYVSKQKLKYLAVTRLDVSAVIIQKAWRFYDCSTNYFLVLAYLIVMQSTVRQYLAKRNIFAAKSSIVTIQNMIRLCSRRKKQRRMFSVRHYSACLVQSAWRLYDCSSNYYLILAYVIVAQCAVRRFLVKVKAEEAKRWNASSKVQSLWLGVLHQEMLSAKCVTVERAQMHIPDSMRRKQCPAMSSSIIFIQAAVRAFSAKQKFNRERASSTLIQSHWRSKSQVDNYTIMHFAATELQPVVRGWMRRRHTSRYQSAAKIQSVWRTTALCKYYKEISFEIIWMQAVIRGWIGRLQYKKAVFCITIVQASVRTLSARVHLVEEMRTRDSATKIQSLWRTLMHFNYYLMLLADTILLQSYMRKVIQKKRRLVECVQRNSASKIQSMWRMRFEVNRMHHTQKNFRYEKLSAEAASTRIQSNLIESVIKIQKFTRMLLSRRELQKKHVFSVAAAKIQSAWRMIIDSSSFIIAGYEVTRLQALIRARLKRQCFSMLIESILILQKSARMQLVRSEFHEKSLTIQAATKIQSFWRMIPRANIFIVIIYEVSRLQAVFRAWIGQKNFSCTIESVTNVQAFIRVLHAKRDIGEMKTMFLAGTKIQSTWRMATKVKSFLITVHEVRQEGFANLRRNAAAVKVQATWRAVAKLNSFIVTIYEVERLQAIIRSKFERQFFASLMRCTVTLQASVRILLARSDLGERKTAVVSATKIQAMQRMVKEVNSFIIISYVVLLLQATVRARIRQQHFTEYRESAIFIQSSIRMLHGKCELHKKNIAVIKIQSMWRMIVEMNSYIGFIYGVTIIQALVRAKLGSNCFSLKIASAITLQLSFRKLFSRCELHNKKTTAAVIPIQSWWRSSVEVTNRNLAFAKVLTLQAAIRGVLGRQKFGARLGSLITMQTFIRMLCARQELEERVIAAALLANAVSAILESCSSKKIQRAWKIRMQIRKERAAAKVIERFFLYVQEEVEKEIYRQERRRQRRIREGEDQLLERIWLTKVATNNILNDNCISMSKQLCFPPTGQRGIGRGLPVTKKRPPYNKSSTAKSPTQYNQTPPFFLCQRSLLSQKELEDDMLMEEVWLEIKRDAVKKVDQAEDEYLTRNGLVNRAINRK